MVRAGEEHKKMVKKWFKPKEHTGWNKDMSSAKRRALLLKFTDKSKSMKQRYLTAFKKINALANVTRDRKTKTEARKDAEYFRKKLKEEKEKLNGEKKS